MMKIAAYGVTAEEFSLHWVSSVSTPDYSPSFDNSNAVRLIFKGDGGGSAEINIYGLATNVAQALCDAIRALPEPEQEAEDPAYVAEAHADGEVLF